MGRPPDLRGNRLVVVLVCVALSLIVWAVFGQTLNHQFVNYDDNEYVYHNSTIKNGLTPAGIVWAFTHIHSANWHPLTTISHMADCTLYGLQPWGHHLTNVLLHMAAAIFLFFALRQLTGSLWGSAAAAAIFAVHPLHVQSVAWISERKDLLSGVFFALALWAYAHYARADRQSRSRYYLMVVIFFALGLMCKPALVTLPFVLLLLDYWPLHRARKPEEWRHLIVEKIPLFVLTALSCAATIIAQKEALIPIRHLAFAERITSALVAYVVYLRQLIYPAHLSVVYPYPEGGMQFLQIIGAFLFLGAATVFAFLRARTQPYLLVGWLWFLGMLVPMIGIIQVGPQPWADRYTYLSHIGLYILLVWGAADLLRRWRRGRELAAVLASLLIIALTAQSFSETTAWRDNETLWHHALANTSNNYIAENNLGKALLDQRRLDEAIGHLRKALEIYPAYPEANNNLGYALANKGNRSDAIPFYEAALRARPDYARAHSNLGVSLAVLGRTDAALGHFHDALRMDENDPDVHYNLANLLLQLGRRDEAVTHLRATLRLRPDDADAQQQLRQFEARP
jgi:protein O-mannosyl-transferase